MSDGAAREAELLSMEAIFPDRFRMVDLNTVSFRFGDRVRLDVVLPEDYPSQSPPKYTLSGFSLTTSQRHQMQRLLDDAYLACVGEPVLFAWVSAISEYMRSLDDDQQASASATDETDSGDSSFQSLPESLPDVECPRIETGELFSDRKSHFQAHIAGVRSKDEVSQVLSVLKSNNKIARATHNMYAYRVQTEKGGQRFQLEDCEDDGEHGASSKMLALLHNMKANNVLVVVTRWYGGVHLGPDRFRHINNLTREIITAHPDMWTVG